jgi:hypothetical protein
VRGETIPRCVGPCYHGVARPGVADGGDGLKIWTVDAIIMKNKSRRGDKGWSSSLGDGRRAKLLLTVESRLL